jgi:lipoyl(octanoyl) transferase
MSASSSTLCFPVIKYLGRCDYQTTWQQMQAFTDTRNSHTMDEIWLLEHPPVFTQGLAGKPEHILNAGDIPVVQTDRGGQVTYHGPGQIVAYVLLDLRRLNIGIRQLVCTLEKCIIAVLAEYGVTAANRADAPGVYVNGAKICSIGLRVRKGCSYHGIALNVDMDLEPFSRINPCGFRDLSMIQLRDFAHPINMAEVQHKISTHLQKNFSYNYPSVLLPADETP